MKKTILTTIVALFCLSASAQFSVMSSINTPEEGESWGVENFTNNIAVGYQLNGDIMVGVQESGEDYDLIARYNLANNLYLSAKMPTENATDNMTLGVGMSVKFWNDLYVEPSYTTKDGEGSLNVGLSYKL